MAELAAGFMVTPSVRLARPLGAGGMGSVWVADHLALRTQVVVKFMSDELSDDKASIARFSREAAAAASVKSPHVVQIFDHGVGELGPFIVMELLEGEDLAHRLARQPVLPPNLVAFIISQTCKALSRAHGVGIVHRDIKPENIFLSGKDDSEIFVKLLDFGIAKGINSRMSSATKTNVVMGSPYYMSPEALVSAKTSDHRSDLWSLGVVAYQALTGRRPFEAETFPGLAIAIHGGEMIPPTKVNPALPPAVDAWWFKACARNREERYNSAKELGDSLYLALGTSFPSYESGGGYVDAGGGFHAVVQPPPAPLPLPKSVPPPGHDTLPGVQASTDAPVESRTFPPEQSAKVPLKKGAPIALFAVLGLLAFAGGGAAFYFLRMRDDGGATKTTPAKTSEPEPTTSASAPTKKHPEPTQTAEPPPPETTSVASTSATASAKPSTSTLVVAPLGSGLHKLKPVPSASASVTASTAPVKTAVPTTTVKPPGYDEDIK
jgi:serine/threonine protein kinase